MPLSASSLSFSYTPAKPILRAITADFPAGAVTAIIGPNGAGKSTLLRLLLGLLRPASGSVTLDGTPLAALSCHQRAARLAYVPQHSSVAFAFSTRAVIRLGRYAADAAETDAATQQALQALTLDAHADEPFGTLSAGQQQRATLARALAQLSLPAQSPSPLRDAAPFLLLDEPVSAMDPAHTLHTLDLLRSLARQGVGIIAVLHDLDLASRIADRVLALGASGETIALGDAAQVLTPPLLERLYGVPFRAVPDPTRSIPILLAQGTDAGRS